MRQARLHGPVCFPDPEVLHDEEGEGKALPQGALESAHLRAGRKAGVLGSSPTLVTMPPSLIRASNCTLAVPTRLRGEATSRASATSAPTVTLPLRHSCGDHQTPMQRTPKTLASFPGPPPTRPALPKAARNARPRQPRPRNAKRKFTTRAAPLATTPPSTDNARLSFSSSQRTCSIISTR